MNCDRAQRILSIPPKYGSQTHRFQPLWATAHFWAALHATHCADCAAFITRLQFLDAHIDRWKADTEASAVPADFQARTARLVGEALRDRAAATMLTTSDTPNRKKPIMLPVTAGTIALATVSAAAAFFMLPQTRPVSQINVPAVMLRPATQVVPDTLHIPPPGAARIRNVHVTTWTPNTNGDLRPEEEIWYGNGRWRKVGASGSRLIVGGAGYPRYDERSQKKVYGTYYFYDPAKHRVDHVPETSEQRTDFTLNSILPWNLQQSMVAVGVETLNGQETVEYLFNSRNATCWHIWVNRVTGLPVRYTRSTYNSSSATWVTVFAEDYEFNKPLNGILFDMDSLTNESWMG